MGGCVCVLILPTEGTNTHISSSPSSPAYHTLHTHNINTTDALRPCHLPCPRRRLRVPVAVPALDVREGQRGVPAEGRSGAEQVRAGAFFVHVCVLFRSKEASSLPMRTHTPLAFMYLSTPTNHLPRAHSLTHTGASSWTKGTRWRSAGSCSARCRATTPRPPRPPLSG